MQSCINTPLVNKRFYSRKKSNFLKSYYRRSLISATLELDFRRVYKVILPTELYNIKLVDIDDIVPTLNNKKFKKIHTKLFRFRFSVLIQLKQAIAE